jgi:putative membrane protein
MLMRILLTGVAVWVAALVVPGVEVGEGPLATQALTVLGVAAIFGVVNAVLGPIVRLFTLPLKLLTLGLFALVVNALLFWLSSTIAQALDLPFEVTGFLPALLGALVVSLVRMALSRLTRES